ncbi:uracil phosphoribosyltransferase [Bacteroidetes bacterium UKL13-3]|jgi:uracil phosphoribosyltransferase|nr:uracil phosphoribosyltransferase [Bacteroidetes bacterium UKL13-3]HCP94452.1 uracil phosphoribosyltransferase [Bacteroidota bacterium]
MQIHLLNTNNSILMQFVAELRDIHIQSDRARFRKNIERIGQIMAYEISKQLEWKTVEITTPLGTHQSKQLAEQPVLATILRAGLSMHQGLLEFFDHADCAFISAYRKHHHNTHDFDIVVEYLACPNIEGKTLLLIDPMLATGQSIELTYKAILQRGTPKHLHIVSLIGSAEGVNYLKEKLPHATLWLADMDDTLNEDGYIIPGLGDAGDLSFGEKI